MFFRPSSFCDKCDATCSRLSRYYLIGKSPEQWNFDRMVPGPQRWNCKNHTLHIQNKTKFTRPVFVRLWFYRMVRAGPLWKLLIRCARSAPKIYIFWKKGDRSSVSWVNGRICGKNLAQDRKYRLTLRFFLKKAVWRWDFGKRPFHAEWRWDCINPENYTCTPCRGWSSLHKTRFFFFTWSRPYLCHVNELVDSLLFLYWFLFIFILLFNAVCEKARQCY